MQQASMCPYLLCEWAPLEALPNHKHVEAGNLVVKDFKYADSHEWVKVDGKTATLKVSRLPVISILLFRDVVEVNKELNNSPGLVNSSPYEKGWIMKVEIKDDSELKNLKNSDEYAKFCEEEDAKH
ncbi:GLYCINE CLEAVAGE SYSTEM H PROTEIN [Salix viminalis]|uniref:GLYCINE CLEAVAGE SYSTEM H PROTEIN n=1 Tax=Salix viminalis TaxID=40686 RepID=A0A9Q0NLA1_SALVM|nr:GLYCINE CLEAVAGE SYSTEM H PROTEIN [Salix viminalis]